MSRWAKVPSVPNAAAAWVRHTGGRSSSRSSRCSLRSTVKPSPLLAAPSCGLSTSSHVVSQSKCFSHIRSFTSSAQSFSESSSDGTQQSKVPWSPTGSHLGRLLKAVSDGMNILLTFEERQHSASSISATGDRSEVFSHAWLRDACRCSHCVNESSGQKTFSTCDLNGSPSLESCNIREDGSLELVWTDSLSSRVAGKNANGMHTSVYPLKFLQQFILSRQLFPKVATVERVIWDRASFEEDMETRYIDYSDWMQGGKAWAKAFRDLLYWGIVFVRGVPETREAVQDIASKIGNLQSTFYGLTWDVESKPNAENVAYTDEYLCLHQDLLYKRSMPPQIQLLHCLQNDCDGGESLFSDGLRAAAEMKVRNPKAFDLLSKFYVKYAYARNGHYYENQRPVLMKRDHWELPRDIYWSPPFQAPFDSKITEGRHKNLSDWIPAAKRFRDSLEAPENMLQFKMRPGDCVLFDNRRVVHGRTKFSTSTGRRHLHGAYIEDQTVSSATIRMVLDGLCEINTEKVPGKKAMKMARQMYGV